MKARIAYYLCMIFLISLTSGCGQIDANANQVSQIPVDETVADEVLEEDKAPRFSNEQIEKVFLSGINDFLWYHPDYLKHNPDAFPPSGKELFYSVLTAPEDIAANRTSNAVMLLSEEETDQAVFFRVYDIFENTGGFEIGITVFNGATLDEIITRFPDYDQNIRGKISIPNESATIPDYGSFEGKEKVVEACRKAIIVRYSEYDQTDRQHSEYEVFIRDFYSYDQSITAIIFEKTGDAIYDLSISRKYDEYSINHSVYNKNEVKTNSHLSNRINQIKEMSIKTFSFAT